MLNQQSLMLHFEGSYEADVFIGYDGERHEYIAHWLDIFGGAGATAVGHGSLHGESLTFLFSYTGEPLFRTIFKRDPAQNEWQLSYASQRNDGNWVPFGDELLYR